MSTKIKIESDRLIDSAGGVRSEPGGRAQHAAAARRSKSRRRFAIVSPMR
jgi:hypothetical protein